MLNLEKESFIGNIVLKRSFQMALMSVMNLVYNKLARQNIFFLLYEFNSDFCCFDLLLSLFISLFLFLLLSLLILLFCHYYYILFLLQSSWLLFSVLAVIIIIIIIISYYWRQVLIHFFWKDLPYSKKLTRHKINANFENSR